MTASTYSGVAKAGWALFILGFILFVVGIPLSHNSLQSLFATIHINGLFFTGVGLFGVFFIALSYAAGAAWNVSLFRILEAMSRILPVGLALIAISIIGNILHISHIFHWMDPSKASDPLIQWKSPYLNVPFFLIRFIAIATVWLLFRRLLLRINNAFTDNGAITTYSTARKISAGFLVIIVVTAPIAAWDWLLSIDVHWFSTIFGWYVFAEWWISGLAFFALLVVSLRKTSTYSFIRPEHLHDTSKWVFTVALVWCYAFFFQYMLIWYAHLPEEITYFQMRTKEYAILFWSIFAINFFVPFFGLMDRDAKRKPAVLASVALALIAGHWLNTYLSVTPGVWGINPPIPLMEIGMMFLMTGTFFFLVRQHLKTTTPLIHAHPLLEESLVYHSDAR